MVRRSDALVVVGPSLHGTSNDRYGWMRVMDVHMVRGGKMREAVIISAILLIAVIIWKPRQKGG